MTRILVGTADGIHEFGLDGTAGAVEQGGRKVTALARTGTHYWAILDGGEIWRTSDDGWSHAATLEGYGGNCLADTDIAGVLVGTSEAHLYRVEKNAIEPVSAFDQVQGRSEWYTPWGGPPDSRSISEDDDAVFVNVHVGGIVRSRDGGATWEPTIDIDSDVHKVWAGWDRVFGACAWGLAASTDAGETWTMRSDGLHAKYCRGVAVTGDTVLVSASNGPRGGRAAVYRGGVGGGPLERCTNGLPEWFDENIDSYCLDAAPDLGVAVFGTEDGRVFASTDEGSSWADVASGLPSIECVLVMPDPAEERTS